MNNKNNNYKKYEKLSQDPNNQFDAVGYNNLFLYTIYFIIFPDKTNY